MASQAEFNQDNIDAAFIDWQRNEYPYAHPVQDRPAFDSGYKLGFIAALSSLPQPVAVGEDEVVEIMAAAAYEEYYRGSGRIHCKWDDATSNERIIHLCEARASIRALLKHAHITKR